MIASDGSCAPKRKCISLNVDGCDGLGIPLRVLSVSKMCRSERKDLELRLTAELEQIRAIQKKIALHCTNGVALPFSRSIQNFNHGQKKKNPIENLHRPTELSSGQGKRQDPSGRSAHHLKRNSSGRFESVKQASLSTANAIIDPLGRFDSTKQAAFSTAMLMKQCETLLKRLMLHQYGWVFNTPVNVVELNIPDYFSVIKHPMDLGTVKSKFASGAYSSPLGFLADVRLTFSNAMTYNPPDNKVHQMADTLSKYFEMRWKHIEKKLQTTDARMVPVKSGVTTEMDVVKPMTPSKKKKVSMMNHTVKPEPVKKIMTFEEKQNLSRELASLGDLPENIIDFLRKQSNNGSQTGEDEIEVDIEAFSNDALYTLQKLLADYLRVRQTTQEKVERCEEAMNGSVLSNSSMQDAKGNDPADEDVDICGNVPTISSYTPTEMEKDAVNNSSNSSRSSRESGCSSSDSYSGSSINSDSGRAKDSSHGKTTRKTYDSAVDGDQKRSKLSDPRNENQSVRGLDKLERNPQCRPLSVEVDICQEGEDAPSERQFSPEKMYRAALLRSRFADTILKAREKTRNQGEKGDPEKLRREREELERQQKQEKARLQAEAKAAEDARRQAEVEAVAEAKRKRELEREAARQALQKMEKTVEINENRRFLEDLEKLRAAPAEHVPSFVEEMGPHQFQDNMASFELRGSSNPLEQLGLYMKMDDDDDDEDEEEVERPSVPDPINDVEEGEID